MKRYLILVITLLVATLSSAQIKKGDREWLGHIRKEHPRMFLTSDDIPYIRQAAYSFENYTFRTIQQRIDNLIKEGVVFKNELARTGESNKNYVYGERVSEAAILWLITQDKKYLDFTKMLLSKLIDYYELRASNNLNINWYSFSVLTTLCAYDWIYNDLTEEERTEMGLALYHATYNVAWHGPGIRKGRYRENTSGPTSGLYGSSMLPWYIGLTFMHDGIDDKECEKMLCNGYDLHQEMTEHRAKLLDVNGGSSSGTIAYGLSAYPYAEYDLIYTFRSAMGIDITPQMKYMIGYLHYMNWIRLPGNKEFGIGDVNHITNNLQVNHIVLHIKAIANLFGNSYPEVLGLASNLISLYNAEGYYHQMTFLPLLNRFSLLDNNKEKMVVSDNKSIHFNALGHIYMRSGQGDDDTYAIFVTERKSDKHQHFDCNNFIIYKRGFRTVDSGTRPQPGQHLSHYYCRTVAHNCITIRMPKEKMPRHWGGPAANENPRTPVPNDGGQNDKLAAKLLEYKETADYVYIVSDATKCYHEAKAEQVVREFVWCAPDLFVVFDRVVADKEEYPKKWLYHTVAEPVIKGNEFIETSQGGKSICRTILPKDVVIEKIGGNGKQFWSDGRNWPLPTLKDEDYKNKVAKLPDDTNPLYGQWRIEVSPKQLAKRDHFLNIILVGDKSLKSLPKTKATETDEQLTLSFKYNRKVYILIFDKTSNYGCKIEVK